MEPNDNGFSIIEMLVVVVIVSLLSATMIPRLGDTFGENGVKKDAEVFINAIGQAQSMANSNTSTGCGVGQKIRKINIEGVNSTGFSMVT